MSGSRLMSAGGTHHTYEEVGPSNRGQHASLRRQTWLLRLVGVAVLIGLVLATTLTLGRKDNLRKVLLWIHTHTAAGFFIFALLYIWFTVLFLPPALLAACAGAIYGFLVAIPLVWVCAVLGETVSFLLGRFLLRNWVRELTADWPMWTALNAALKEDGWKLVALLRVSPVVPFSIINYALGSSSLPFSHYFWPSVFGIIPGLIIYVWLGSLAADVTEAMAGHGSVRAPPAARIAIIVCGAVSALVVVVLSAVYTKRAIDRRLAHVHVYEETQVDQHQLLEESSEDGGASRSVVVSVETPVLVAESDISRRGLEGDAQQAPADLSGSAVGWLKGLLGQVNRQKQKPRKVSEEDACSSGGELCCKGYDMTASMCCGSGGVNGIISGTGSTSCSSSRPCSHSPASNVQPQQHQVQHPVSLTHISNSSKKGCVSCVEHVDHLVAGSNSGSSGGGALLRRGSKGDLLRVGNKQ